MTIDEYAEEYGGLEDYSGPSEDPETQAMLEHLVEFETEMYRMKCKRRLSGCTYEQLRGLMVNIHGEGWKNAL